jgi:hypothetical protein
MTDHPPLFGEDWLWAQLLDIVCKHCRATGDELDSHAIPAHADLMSLCAEGCYIEITGERDGRIFAKVLPEGCALLDSLRADPERGAKP